MRRGHHAQQDVCVMQKILHRSSSEGQDQGNSYSVALGKRVHASAIQHCVCRRDVPRNLLWIQGC